MYVKHKKINKKFTIRKQYIQRISKNTFSNNKILLSQNISEYFVAG